MIVSRLGDRQQHHRSWMPDDLHVDGVPGRQLHDVDLELENPTLIDGGASEQFRGQPVSWQTIMQRMAHVTPAWHTAAHTDRGPRDADLASWGGGAAMKRREFIVSSVAGSVGATLAPGPLVASASEDIVQPRPSTTRKILIAGGNYNTAFMRYMAQLTGKPRPKLLYLPTASADSPSGTITFYRNCSPLNVEPSHQNSFIASTQQPRSWEEVFLSVDGIVCSGGNTLEPAGDLEGARHRRRSFDRRGIGESCSVAPVRDRCAGSRKAPPIRARKNCRRSIALASSRAAIPRITTPNRAGGRSIRR